MSNLNDKAEELLSLIIDSYQGIKTVTKALCFIVMALLLAQIVAYLLEIILIIKTIQAVQSWYDLLMDIILQRL